MPILNGNLGFPGCSDSKQSAYNAGDLGSYVPGGVWVFSDKN